MGVTSFLDISALPTRYSLSDDYPYTSSLSVGGKPLQVVSSLPLENRQVSELSRHLQALPPNLTDLFKETSEKFSIALLGQNEIRPLAGVSVYGLYDPPTKILYLPREDPGIGFRFPNADTIRHEMVHATMDTIVRDSVAVGASFSFWRLFRKTWFAYEDFFKEDTALLSAIFTFLIPSALTGFFVIKKLIPGPYRMKIGLAAAAISLVGGLLVYDRFRKSNSEGRGIIKDEFKKKIKDQPKGNRRTVSGRAGESLGEFSAETMLAYLQSKQETSDRKNREELARLHPRLYLAYAAFFDPESPVRFLPTVFDRQDLIDRTLSKYRRNDGLYRLDDAKRDLFANYR